MTWQPVIFVLAATVMFAGCAGDTVTEPTPGFCGPKDTRVPCSSARIGVEYPMALWVHCGVDWAYVDGRFWVIEPGQPNSAEQIYGVVRLTDRSNLEFRGDGFRYFFKQASASYSPPPCY